MEEVEIRGTSIFNHQTSEIKMELSIDMDIVFKLFEPFKLFITEM